MSLTRGLLLSIAALTLLAIMCHATVDASSNDGGATSHAISADASGNNTASIPDFDGDGTIGFGDFLKFGAKFGLGQSDDGYDALYDLNGDGEIGFSDFVIFAQNFGKKAPSPTVTIPDANLRAAIETALGKDSDASITQVEMAAFDSLDASDSDISDLTGLEFAVNLTYLSLNDNKITDILALASLTNLERLLLSNNRIEDISALSRLTNITELWLWNNRIEDISALSKLTNLTRLSLGRNNITDISALSGLTNLTTLVLSSNRISDLAPLVANKGLGQGGTVDVTDNPLNAATQSTHIPALRARGVSISFVVAAVTFPDANLRAIIQNRLGKATGTPIYRHELAILTSLDARYTIDDRIYVPIRDLEGIQFCTNLVELRLSDSVISATSPVDLSPLANLTNLRLLWLHGINNVEDPLPLDLSPLTGLINLTKLDLRANNISDISPLSGLTDLTELNLHTNTISNISPLSGLTNLTYLDLRENRISDVSPLAGLTKLREVLLSINNISNLAPLSTNTGLGSGDIIDVRTNPLDAASISTHITALLAKGVRVSFDEFFVFTDPQVYDDKVFVLPVSDNLAAGKLPLTDYTARFYGYFNDEFDFLMFVPNLAGSQVVEAERRATYSSVKNDVEGIGRTIFSNNSRWSSAGKLQGVINFGSNSVYSISERGRSIVSDGPTLHELMHRWANFIVPSSYASHWGFSSANGNAGGFDIADLVDQGGGRYTAGYFTVAGVADNIQPYGFIELYLAGFIPPAEVPDLWVAEDGEWLRDREGRIVQADNGLRIFTASKVKTHTIEDIIAEHGTRVPNHTDSQKDFRAAVILLVNEDFPATREVLETISRDVSWFSHAGDDESHRYNFYEATGGTATIKLDGLSQFRRGAGASKPASSSLGTPPPPVEDHWDTGHAKAESP